MQRENPLVCTMGNMLRDFRRINPPILIGSKTLEDPQEFIDKVHKILVALGARCGMIDDLWVVFQSLRSCLR